MEFDKVKLGGVHISRATGFNGEFIATNVVGPGSRILIIRSGDVIPYIQKVLTPATSGKPQMPLGEFKWNETKKDILIVSGDVPNEQHEFRQLENFFEKLEIRGISGKTAQKVYDAGFTTIQAFLKMKQSDVDVIPGLVKKAEFLGKIKDRLDNISCMSLMQASNVFGKGFGERRLNSIVDAIPKILNNKYTPTIGELEAIDGVSTITAEAFIEGLKNFRVFMDATKLKCPSLENKVKEKKKENPGVLAPARALDFTGQVIVFTGFRNKEWEQVIKDAGGTTGSGVTGKSTMVVTKDPDSDSKKLNDARDKGINIVSIDDFQKMIA